MCGIVAIFSPNGGVEARPIKRAMQALEHRGPDGQGSWISQDSKVGLGHSRLSIIDLETGSQPIANEDNSLHLVVNGEFYDHDRIRAELTARGHHLATSSDSEIALHLYEDYGTGLMDKLRGEFAFILWDQRNQVLIAARDRFGIKPLYYAWHQGSLYLASEAKALFAAGVPAAWDHESFHQKIFTSTENDRSMFRGVRQVPPGHLMLTTAWGSKTVPYWDQDYPLETEVQASYTEKEVVAQMHDQLLEATRLRMRADVPVGCYLSGGLDSCALLGIASTLHSQPIEAFTIAFEEEDFDEGPIAEEMAREAGANFHPFLMSADLRADNFADAIWYSEAPHGNGNTVAKYLLSEQVRNYGFKVVLTGEGSDEIFGGYPMFRQDMVSHHSGGSTGDKESDMQAIRARNTVARFMVSGDEQPNIAAAEGALGFTPNFLKAFASRAELFGPLLSEEFSHEFHGRDPNRVFLNGIDLRSLKGRQNISQSLYLWTKSMLPDILLNHLGDRMEMAHSIEGRTPFLDHHLVSAVNRMPIEMKIRGITEKYVLREAARPYITQTVYERQKHPFISPPATSGRFGQMLRDTLWSKALEDIPFFDAAAVRAAFDGLEKMSEPAQRQGLAFVLTSISSACVLHDRFGL